MNSSRYNKKHILNDQQRAPRIYQYAGKESQSISQQIVEDVSQSSFSESQTRTDEESLFTFCKSQRKRNPNSVESSLSGSQQQNIQLNLRNNNQKYSNNNIYQTSSNNQPKLQKNRGKSENSKRQKKHKRCSSLNLINDQFIETFHSASSTSSSSESSNPYLNSIRDIPYQYSKNPQNFSFGNLNFINRPLTRSVTHLLSQQTESYNNINQSTNNKMITQSCITNAGQKAPFQIVIRGKNQNKEMENNVNPSKKKIETTKYKKKDKYYEENDYEDSLSSSCSGSAAGKTQPKFRKNEMNPQNYCNDSIDYYSSTAKQVSSRDNKMVNNNLKRECLPSYQDEISKKVHGEKKNNINISITNTNNQQNSNKMKNEGQLPILKIIKKDQLFQQTQAQNIFAPNNNNNSYQSNKGGKIDSAQTSVTQYKRDQEINNNKNNSNNTSYSVFNNNSNKEQKKIIIKRPFTLFEEDGFQESDRNSLKSSDETHLNINQNNIWNKDKENTREDCPYDLFNPPNKQINNIWDKNENNENLNFDFHSIFQKKVKNSLQQRKFIGVDQAFTVEYEKMRFQSFNQNKAKFFEFNCFKDSDLQVDEKYQKKLQEITIDDDVQTDEETLDYYIEVCFTDLVEAIDLQNQQSQASQDNEDSESAQSLSQTNSNVDHLWDYFYPPNHSEINN